MILYKKRKKYKYTLQNVTRYDTGFSLDKDYDTDLLNLSKDGMLTILPGYSWDGPSGPAIDSKSFMRASLIHDALYQLMRDCGLPKKHRKQTDEIMRDILLEDGLALHKYPSGIIMRTFSRLRAWYAYKLVRIFGGFFSKPDMKRAG